MPRTEEDWVQRYCDRGALWIHDGSGAPHALLTSEKHSNGFFNSGLVTGDEVLREEAAHDLVEMLLGVGELIDHVDCVVGPATGATKLAMSISRAIALKRGRDCRYSHTEKREEGGVRTMVFPDGEVGKIAPGDRVLLCDDVNSTGGSAGLVADAVARCVGIVLPCVLVLVNRSGKDVVHGKKVLALINRAMPMWPQDLCPLCKKGSLPVRPKDQWDRLTQRSPTHLW